MSFLRAEIGFRIYSRSRLARVRGLLAQNINFGKTHGALPAGQLHSDLDGEDLKLTENGIGGRTGLYLGHLAAAVTHHAYGRIPENHKRQAHYARSLRFLLYTYPCSFFTNARSIPPSPQPYLSVGILPRRKQSDGSDKTYGYHTQRDWQCRFQSSSQHRS